MRLSDQTDGRGLARQAFATFTMCLIMFSIGVANSIIGVFTDQVTSDPGELALTSDQISWVSSSLYVGNMVGYLASSRLSPQLGAARLTRFCLPPLLAGWLATALGGRFAVLVAGRLLAGLATGVLGAPLHTYIGEIASASVRGTLGTGVMICCTCGILSTFVGGWFLHWQTVCLVFGAGATALAFMASLTLPSSPKWLVTKGRDQEAERALRYFHGDQFNVALEIKAIRDSIGKDHTEDTSLTQTAARLRRHLRPLLLVLANHTLFAVSGGVPTTLFAPVVFRLAGLPPYQGAVLVGAVRLGCVLVSSALVDRLERRHLLLANGVLGGLGCAAAAAYLWRPALLGGEPWLCVVALLAVVGAMAVGLQALAGVLLAELLPNAVRAEASSLVMLYFGLLNFATVYALPWAARVVGMAGLYAFFGAMHVALIVFSFAVPRTRGRSLEEIQDTIHRRKPDSYAAALGKDAAAAAEEGDAGEGEVRVEAGDAERADTCPAENNGDGPGGQR